MGQSFPKKIDTLRLVDRTFTISPQANEILGYDLFDLTEMGPEVLPVEWGPVGGKFWDEEIYFLTINFRLHPGKRTCPPKMDNFNRKCI